MNNGRLVLILGICSGLLISMACKQETWAATEQSAQKAEPCAPGDEYFPPATATWFGSGLHFGVDQAEWESNLLRHMNEPSLYKCGDCSDDSAYRFLWDRSLNEPIVARLVIHKDGSGTLYVRRLAHSGLRPPPKPGSQPIPMASWYRMNLDKQIQVTPQHVETAVELLGKINFWSPRPLNETTDGSDWIFESKVQGKYRLVDFRNVASPAAREFGLYLVITLAKLSIPAEAIY